MVSCKQVQSWHFFSCFLIMWLLKKLSTVHLNFPAERKHTDHNEFKNMLITICLFPWKCGNVRIAPFWLFWHHVGVVGWNIHRGFFGVFPLCIIIVTFFNTEVSRQPPLPSPPSCSPTLLLCIKERSENRFQTMSYYINFETKEMVT